MRAGEIKVGLPVAQLVVKKLVGVEEELKVMVSQFEFRRQGPGVLLVMEYVFVEFVLACLLGLVLLGVWLVSRSFGCCVVVLSEFLVGELLYGCLGLGLGLLELKLVVVVERKLGAGCLQTMSVQTVERSLKS
jgi:hypothetical protein